MKFALLVLSTLLFCGCYQAHSDDDLRGVPVTNNPNIIPFNQTAQNMGMPY